MNTVGGGEESYDVPWEFSKNCRNLANFVNGRADKQQQQQIISPNSQKSPPPPIAAKPNSSRCTCSNNRNSNSSNNVVDVILTNSSISKNINNFNNSSFVPPPPPPPACGVKAREIMKNKHNSSVQQQQKPSSSSHASENNYIVWQYRGPDTDSRPSSDYDPPWDLRPSTNVGRSENNPKQHPQKYNETTTIDSNNRGNNKKGDKDESTGSQNSADSGVYDEPWEKNSIHRHSMKINQSLSYKNATSPTNSCNPSPCTSRSNSSQGSVSIISGGSRETLNNPPLAPLTITNNKFVRNSTAKKEILTSEASTNTPPSESLCGERSSSSSSSNLTSTIISSSAEQRRRTPPIMETAFCCSKTNKTNVSLESSRLQEVRDRLIQQLCNSSTDNNVTDANGSNPKTSVPPMPAIRKSKLKSVDDVVGRRSDESIVKCRRSVDGSSSTTTKNLASPDEKVSPTDKTSTTTNVEVYDIPWEFTCNNGAAATKLDLLKNRLQQQQQRNDDENVETTTNKRNSNGALAGGNNNVSTSSSSSSKKLNFNRQNLRLNFGCAGLNPVSEKVDVGLSLDQQPWYHGNITRAEAEQRLRGCKEGSYLVRVCESAQCQKHEEYALSLKSAKGFMHMKIQLDADKKWILGYFSHPFESISKMIRYYSVNKLPIKGAEHMCLLHPIADQVL